ncbi:unnamed protein product, partial [Gulo gulo]
FEISFDFKNSFQKLISYRGFTYSHSDTALPLGFVLLALGREKISLFFHSRSQLPPWEEMPVIFQNMD